VDDDGDCGDGALAWSNRERDEMEIRMKQGMGFWFRI